MKLIDDRSDYYVIMSKLSGTQQDCFWGYSCPDGRLCTRNSIEHAWEFASRKQALRILEKYSDKGPAKVVRVKSESTTTIYIRDQRKIKTKKKVEKYIRTKIWRAHAKWKRANEKYEKKDMRSAANLYADAMLLFYECFTDLIDGTGFIEEKEKVK